MEQNNKKSPRSARKKPSTLDRQLSVRVSQTLWAQLESEAEKDELRPANIIRRILRNHYGKKRTPPAQVEQVP